MFLNEKKVQEYMKKSELELWNIILNAPNAHTTYKDRHALLYALEAVTRKKE